MVNVGSIFDLTRARPSAGPATRSGAGPAVGAAGDRAAGARGISAGGAGVDVRAPRPPGGGGRRARGLLKWGTSVDLPTYPRRESWTVWQRRQARGTTWIRLAS